MAYGPLNEKLAGHFREKQYGKSFDYSINAEKVLHPDLKTGRNTVYPHKVWVIDGYRMALVKKTVAYIVVDENDWGFVIERWNLKNHRCYTK